MEVPRLNGNLRCGRNLSQGRYLANIDVRSLLALFMR